MAYCTELYLQGKNLQVVRKEHRHINRYDEIGQQ